MSYALSLLLGGALFMATWTLLGQTAVAVLAVVLIGVELIHDLRLYQRGRGRGAT